MGDPMTSTLLLYAAAGTAGAAGSEAISNSLKPDKPLVPIGLGSLLDEKPGASTAKETATKTPSLDKRRSGRSSLVIPRNIGLSAASTAGLRIP